MSVSPAVVAAILFVAVAGHSRTYESAAGEVTNGSAKVVMRSSTGESLGTLRMERGANGGSRLVGTLTGVPAGTHGIHVHAVGRCDAPAFEGAGAHLNPLGKQHGLQNPAGPHAGDAPNIQADATRRAPVDIAFSSLTLSSAASAGLFDADGSAVVVHESMDDQKTDPTGNSGARIACGVIDRSN